VQSKPHASFSPSASKAEELVEPESTPERILREFKERAKAYKFATEKKSAGVAQPMAARQEWKRLMKECKDMWELRTADLYNPSPCVLYDAYLVNLSHTLAARLSLICGKQVRVNLR